MRIDIDGEKLSFTISLDKEHPDLDLSYGLGEQLVELAAEAQAQEARSGTGWAPLAESTVRQKHHSTPGLRTGSMLTNLDNGDVEVEERKATWTYPARAGSTAFYKCYSFHNGNERCKQPPRPIIRVPSRAENEIRRRVAEEDFYARD